MATIPPELELVATSRSFLLERVQYRLKHAGMDRLAYMMYNEFQLTQHWDAIAGEIVHAFTSAAKGEVTEESRTETFDFTFEVFATWWDHLKYVLIRDDKLPRWITRRWGSVRYQKINQKRTVTYPIKVIRACPHVMADWNSKPHIHLAYLFPSETRFTTES